VKFAWHSLWLPISAAAVLGISTADAGGYGYDPASTYKDGPGNIYFGVARNASGNYVPGVTVILETRDVNFVLYTDDTGRFRTKLPLNVNPGDVTAHCSRNGYRAVKVIKRTPPAGRPSPVQVDCVLQQ
jgi:hypothetical protein